MHWLGEISQTTAAICYRAVAAGTYFAKVGTETSAPAVANLTVDDGVMRFDVSGLQPNRDYTYEIFWNGGVVATGTLTTMPNEEVPFSIAYVSCWFHDSDAGEWVYDFLQQHAPSVRMVVFLGDTPYIDVPSSQRNLWGVDRKGFKFFLQDRITAVAGGVAASYDYTNVGEIALMRENYYGAHRSFRSMPGVKKLIERYATLWIADDHEYPGDNLNRFDWDNANDAPGIDIIANTTQAGQIMALCRQWFRAYYKGNPANADTNRDVSYDTTNQTYYRLPINGNVEVFCVDNTEYKTSELDAVTVRKILGDTQRTWLTTQVGASVANNKLIFAPAAMTGTMLKSVAQETGAHPQTANGSDNGERDLLVRALSAYTSIAWLCGDTHHSHVSIHNGIPSINACPIFASNAVFGDRLDGRVWMKGGLANDYDPTGCFGIVDISQTGAQHWIVEQRGKYKTNVGKQLPGNNQMTFPSTKLS